MFMFSKEIAMICGVNAAIIAQFIRDEIDSGEGIEYGDETWYRCSMFMMTGYVPFFTKYAVADAIKKLIKAKVIKRGCYNSNKFDHTNWYTFTEYGEMLLNRKNAEM